MTTKEIYEVLVNSGIRISAEYADLVRRGYDSDAAQRFSEELVEDMSRIVEHGVNYGFNGSMKDVIDMLADMALDMDRRGISSKITRLRTKKDEAVARMKPTKGDNVDLRRPVLGFITSSFDGLDVIASGSADDERVKSFAAESREKLEKLRELVRTSPNHTSEGALRHASRIMEFLGYWRNSAAVRLFDSTALGFLDEALVAAEAWHSVIVKGDRVKPEDVPVAPRDEMFKIAGSGKSKEMLGGLRAELKRKIARVEDIAERRAALVKERGECSAELDEIAREWQNGKLDDMTADMRSSALENRISGIDNELAQADMRMGFENDTLSVCRDLENTLASYEDDPAMLYVIAEQIDFGRVNAFLMGHVDAASGRKLLDDISTVIAAEAASRSEMTKLIVGYREVTDERNRRMHELMRERREMLGEKQSPQSARERMAARLKKLPNAPDRGTEGTDRIDLTGETGELNKEDL